MSARVQASLAEWELQILRQAVRIAREYGSLSGYADDKALDGLARKIDRLIARSKVTP